MTLDDWNTIKTATVYKLACEVCKLSAEQELLSMLFVELAGYRMLVNFNTGKCQIKEPKVVTITIELSL